MAEPIWNPKGYTAEDLNANIPEKSILALLDIRFTEISDKLLRATMPVDERTHQIHGILHGGATCVLAETVGSIASLLCIDEDTKTAVGSQINANHLRPITEGRIECICRPIHIGRSKHVWDMEIRAPNGKLIAKSELTTAVIDKPNLQHRKVKKTGPAPK